MICKVLTGFSALIVTGVRVGAHWAEGVRLLSVTSLDEVSLINSSIGEAMDGTVFARIFSFVRCICFSDLLFATVRIFFFAEYFFTDLPLLLPPPVMVVN